MWRVLKRRVPIGIGRIIVRPYPRLRGTPGLLVGLASKIISLTFQMKPIIQGDFA